MQCTANGYGERAGNADLFAVVGNLVTKLGMPVLPEGALAELTRTSHALAEIANIAPDTHQAYVGSSAFAHKAGLHASAIKVDPELYNHMDPVVVGNGQRVLVTEMAGRASVELKGAELGLDLAGRPTRCRAWSPPSRSGSRRAGRSRPRTPRSSCSCGRRSTAGTAAAPFPLESYRVITEQRADGEVVAEATVKVVVDGQRLIATAEGNGPVNALDAALRAALAPRCPWLGRGGAVGLQGAHPAAPQGAGRRARHRRGDPGAAWTPPTATGRSWTTVGVHGNVVEASWLALVDALTYAALRAEAPRQSSARRRSLTPEPRPPSTQRPNAPTCQPKPHLDPKSPARASGLIAVAGPCRATARSSGCRVLRAAGVLGAAGPGRGVLGQRADRDERGRHAPAAREPVHQPQRCGQVLRARPRSAFGPGRAAPAGARLRSRPNRWKPCTRPSGSHRLRSPGALGHQRRSCTRSPAGPDRSGPGPAAGPPRPRPARPG